MPSPPVVYAPAPQGRFASWATRIVERTPRWVAPLFGTGTIGAAASYTLLVQPTTLFASTHSTCIMRILTGFDCPGCGGTRSAWYLLHGDIAEAARHHAPFVFIVPFLLYMYVVWALNTAFGLRLPQLQLSTKSIMIFMAVWGVFSVLRNLPWAPFTALYI
ncbi:MAG: DUF2752 domain-containing protein [Dactylosporangium sp.]|nr:DUF2752 domain-containing protein [Dactylosporangium sp.]NNJ61794.1 DUF2752 domain-containing protein [Dactylosporangium sp.]